MLSLEGSQLGNYDVIRRIRVGGMGAVYEGRQRTAFGRRVAIKVILGDYATDRDMRRRFAREARTIARLHHPHILPLIEFGDEHGLLYLVMPFIDGGTLTSYLRRSLPDLGEVAAIYQQLLDAVEYAHDEGLIHRDIKSSNVLLEMRRSGPPYIYLADFGLVRIMRHGETQPAGKPIPLDQVPGTPHYMAPEQTLGIVTPLTDIYALGVLLYQLLTGTLPYNDPDEVRVIQMHLHAPIPSPCDSDASIPRELGEVVRTAMAKRAEDRYQNVAELRAAFLTAIKGPLGPQEREQQETQGGRTTLQLPQTPITPQRRPPSTALPMQGEPEPIVIPRRVRDEVPPVAVRELRERPEKYERQEKRDRQERPRVTDSVRNVPRITEEPVGLKPATRRVRLPVLASLLATILLLALLILPRVLGFSLFPAGFPLLGTPPVATVYITAQTKSLQDRYLLTASPQVKTADVAAHAIPARIVQGSSSDSSVILTTGLKTIPGVQAHGIVEFTNNGDNPVQVTNAFILTTGSGVRLQLTQNIQVPGRQNGQGGKASAAAIAVSAGVVGNIAAHALDGTCCNNTLSVRNPDPFTGGVDAQTQHTVAQADLDGVAASLAPRLKGQLTTQLQKQLTSDEALAGQPAYTQTVTSTIPVGEQSDHVQVTVKIDGRVSAYNRTTAAQTAMQLLSKQAAQTLAAAYQLSGKLSLVSSPSVSSNKGDIIYLNVSVHGLWTYRLTTAQLGQWRQSIKGAAPAVAEAYLKQQPGVAHVDIRLPFNTDHLPSATDDIHIVLPADGST